MATKYFERPTQVLFRDPNTDEGFIGGIAYRDEIICGCCGGLFELDELDEVSDLLPFGWINISNSIRGGMSTDEIEEVIKERNRRDGNKGVNV